MVHSPGICGDTRCTRVLHRRLPPVQAGRRCGRRRRRWRRMMMKRDRAAARCTAHTHTHAHARARTRCLSAHRRARVPPEPTARRLGRAVSTVRAAVVSGGGRATRQQRQHSAHPCAHPCADARRVRHGECRAQPSARSVRRWCATTMWCRTRTSTSTGSATCGPGSTSRRARSATVVHAQKGPPRFALLSDAGAGATPAQPARSTRRLHRDPSAACCGRVSAVRRSSITRKCARGADSRLPS